MERYRSLARFQNHRNSFKYYVSLTLYYQLNNLRQEYNHLLVSSSVVSNFVVARAYFGQQNVSQTMSMLASTAMRLPQHTLEELRCMSTSEHPDLIDRHNIDRAR